MAKGKKEKGEKGEKKSKKDKGNKEEKSSDGGSPAPTPSNTGKTSADKDG